MTHKCTLCHKDLPDEAFTPSFLRRKQYQCKKCVYERYGKKADKKFKASLDSLPEKIFDAYYGGYIVSIINFVRPHEYKYTIKGTNGFMVQTNDLEYFRKKFDELVGV